MVLLLVQTMSSASYRCSDLLMLIADAEAERTWMVFEQSQKIFEERLRALEAAALPSPPEARP
jgi:hypothetical protein